MREMILGCLLWCLASNATGVAGLLLLMIRGCLQNLTICKANAALAKPVCNRIGDASEPMLVTLAWASLA